jgi:glycine/D-amino acid oxidase-like deaminating enzyme
MTATASGAVPDCEVAVIGGGMLGLATAFLASQRGYHVHLYRLGNDDRPRADTLRNQGWLQSGLIYVGKIAQLRGGKPIPNTAEAKAEARKRGRLVANQMYAAGLTLLDGLGIARPKESDRGILRVHPNEEHERIFLEDARALGLKEEVVQKLPPDQVKKRLGSLFEDGNYYVIPDAPFPESRVLELLRENATKEGTVFIECKTPVHLERDSGSPSRHVVTADGWRHSSLATVVAAGAGSQQLLDHLGIDAGLKFQHTPLLVLDGCHAVEIPIFADRPRGFSLVRHAANGPTLPEGALVIGTNVLETDIPFVPYHERKVRDDQVKKFLEHLPDCLSCQVTKHGRFTSGFEVIPHGHQDEDGYDYHYVEPWVRRLGATDNLNLLIAMPGRATTGLLTAEMVLSELDELLDGLSRGSKKSIVVGGWNGGIDMHFHRHYGKFDDRN